jgi:hypothetical protein
MAARNNPCDACCRARDNNLTIAGIGARIVPWRQLAIGTIVKVSDRLTAPTARARPVLLGGHSRFSGTSARQGVTSTAIEARVDEASLYLQSGNGAAIPAQAYMRIAFIARFLETSDAFGL